MLRAVELCKQDLIQAKAEEKIEILIISRVDQFGYQVDLLNSNDANLLKIKIILDLELLIYRTPRLN